MTQRPASIRYNNPGAQYPGPSANRFGSTGTEIIGGGHKIAVFDDPVKGAAAQFDLLSRNYSGMTLQDAIHKWSGGNSSGAYARQISQATGIPLDGVLSREKLADPSVAIPLAKTAADWEAGGSYPMSGEDWSKAFQMAQGGAVAPAQTASAAMPQVSTPAASGQTGDQDVNPLMILLQTLGSGGAAASGSAAVGGAAQAGGGLFGALNGQGKAGALQDPDSTDKLASSAMQDAAAPAQQPNLLGRRMAQAPDMQRIRQAIRGRLGIMGV